MVKRKLAKDEVDLIEFFQIIWVKKHIIIISIIFGLLIVFLIQSFKKPSKIVSRTKVIPISIYVSSEFQMYNSVLKNLEANNLFFLPDYMQSNENFESRDEEGAIEFKKKQRKKIENVEINNITKQILFEMFIEIFEQRVILRNIIKKFNFIKKEDYTNKEAYEIAIDKTLSEIRLLNTNDLASQTEFKSNVIIELESYNLDEWESFLIFVEKEINQRVQIKLSKMFEKYLDYVKMLERFSLEDIESRLTMVTDDNEKLYIIKSIDQLKNSKYSQRLVELYNSSPISKKDKFIAAKISIDTTTYELNTDKNSLKNLYSLSAILGGILGIFFVVIANGLQKRSKKIIS